MVGSCPVAQAIERRLDLRLERRERRHGSLLGAVHFRCGDVELRPVAGGETDGLALVLSQPRCERLRFFLPERHLLTQLDRRVMVRGADEDEMHHAK